MKRRKLLIYILICMAFFSMAFFCLFALTACNDNAIPTPTGLKIDETTLELSWDEVEDAKNYTVSFNGQEITSKKNSYFLTSLEAGEYEIRVKAVAGKDDQTDSAWSEKIDFTREYECGLSYTLVNNSYYEVSGIGTATGDVVMTNSYRGKPVQGIGDKAFNNRSALTSITIADSVTYIGKYAFANCSQLQKVTFSKGVESIGAYAFQSCRAITELTIPSNVQTVDEYAFSYCRGVKKVTIAEGVESIGERAFAECTGLTEVKIASSVEEIGAYAFYNDTALTKATIGGASGAATVLGEYSFSRSGVSELSLGENVAEIGNYAFSVCDSLAAVNIPNGVTTIGEGAFYNSPALTEVTLGSGLKGIGRYAFVATGIWTDAENLVYADHWLVGNKDTSLTTVTIKDDTVGIAKWAFYPSTKLNRITVPASVKIIDDYAFYNCSALVNAVIEGAESIGSQAFRNCKLLSYVSLPAGLTTIGQAAFASCTRLENITLPDSLRQIGYQAFYGSGIWENSDYGVVYADRWAVGFKEIENSEDGEDAGNVNLYAVEIAAGTVGIADYCFYTVALTSVSMPNSVTELGRCAFYKCDYLLTVVLSKSLTEIKDYTFYQCGMLYSCSLPDGIERIGRSAFYKAAQLFPLNLTIPESVTYIAPYAFFNSNVVLNSFGGAQEIGARAFAYCNYITAAYFSDSLKTIGERAFYDCEGLAEIDFGGGVTTIGERAFYKCVSLTSLTLPDQVTSIGRYAFFKCTALEEVTFGKGLKEISDYAFSNCTALKHLYLPTTIQSIGVQAFRNCSALTAVTLPQNITSVAKHAFYGCKQATFYAEAASRPDGWVTMWNSSYRPVVWGATLSADKSYVSSVTVAAGTVSNPRASGGVTAPDRPGYTFVSWTDADGKTYAASELPANAGTFSAVWKEGVEEVNQQSNSPEKFRAIRIIP